MNGKLAHVMLGSMSPSLLKPVVSLGKEFWGELRDFVDRSLVGEGTIDPADLELTTAAESPVDAVDIIDRACT